jgi:hypothetical protein
VPDLLPQILSFLDAALNHRDAGISGLSVT